MKRERLVVIVTVVNAVFLLGLIASNVRSLNASQPTISVLRGRALEIVDEQGLIRASIKVHGAETVNGKRYGGAVVLVMGDPRGEPGVKLAASEGGAGLGLSNGYRLPDGRSAGIQLNARDTASFVVLVEKLGRQRILRP